MTIIVSKMGYYIVWCLIAGGLATIGCGIITLWNPSSSVGTIVGYQLFLGARGAGLQMGIVAIQHALSPKEAAIASSFLIFTQNFFASIFVTIGNTIFQESLRSNIAAHVPGITPDEAIAAGGSAQAVRKLASPGPQLDALLEAYSKSFSNVFYLLIGTSALAVLCSFAMGWADIRQKPKPKSGEA